MISVQGFDIQEVLSSKMWYPQSQVAFGNVDEPIPVLHLQRTALFFPVPWLSKIKTVLLELNLLVIIFLTYSSSGKPGMEVLKAYFYLINMEEAKDADLPEEKQLFLSS